MKKVSVAIALIGPVFLITILSAVTWQMNQQRTISFDASAYAIWMLVMGLLVGLYLALTLVVLPKCATPTLVICAVIGAILAAVLGVIDWYGFGINLPIRLESLTTLNLTGVLVVGNLACAVLARRGCAGTE